VPVTSDYVLGGNDVDLTNMVGHMRTPAGTIEQCVLKKMPNGKLGELLIATSADLSVVGFVPSAVSPVPRLLHLRNGAHS
jgi:hypothetical protein